ncbi:MAG TPA: nuclear transport factor 2 family protein [Acidimicrobiales bacterium]|jgi:ketosteroid isomerase-like protein|nr:nuclear transport factor 2 family protein [Acidimicrobiales bacterium]
MAQPTSGDSGSITEEIRRANGTRNLDVLAPLLADDVTWGDAGHPRGCRNRSDVLATFSRQMAEGAGGQIAELSQGSEGLLCGLTVEWPEGHPRSEDRTLFHVYRIRDGLITRIERYDDRGSASEAAGVV